MTGAQLLFARYRRNDYISSPLVSVQQDAKTLLRNPRKFDDLNATKNGCFVRHRCNRFVGFATAVSLRRQVTDL